MASAEPNQAERIEDPGAKISTHLPKFEYEAGASTKVVAPTVIAVGALAGDRVHASVVSLPAAATTVIPAFVSYKIAAFSAVEKPPPILKLRTA